MIGEIGAAELAEGRGDAARKPPLPMISRTPYCCISGRVKRSIRSDVVVPMQTGA